MNPFFTCRLGLVAVLCLIPQLVNASLIRDTELEAGLEHISAPLTRADRSRFLCALDAEVAAAGRDLAAPPPRPWVPFE